MRREFAAAAPEPDGVLYEAEVVRWARWERLVRTPLDEWRADEGRAACAAPLTAHGLLLAARELLGENGERWTQRAAAVDARGADVAPEDREAAAWSGAGALYAAFGPQHLATDAEIGVLVDAESALVFALPPPGDSSIVTVNDERPFAAMAAVYARAIESRSRAAASRQQSAIAPGSGSPRHGGHRGTGC